MVQIIWTELALNDPESIYNYISIDSPLYAKKQIELIVRRVEIVSEHPLSGRKVPELDDELIREVIEGNYRIIYKIQKDSIYIVRLHHTSNCAIASYIKKKR